MGNDKHRVIGYLSVLGICIVRSSVIVLDKYLLRDFNPWTLGFLYSIIASIFIFLINPDKSDYNKIRNKENLFNIILIGILGFSLNLCLLIGLKHSTAVNASVIVRVEIMFSAILGWIFLKEKMRTLDFLGVAFMLGGFFLVSGINPLKFKFHQAGDILFLIQALLLSVNALLIKRLLVKGISGFVIASINLLLTSILFFSFSFFLDYISDIGLVFEGINILLVSALGILVGSNYLFYYSALRNIPIWLVKVLVLFVPILTAILGYLFLSEILTQRHFYGIILTIAGGIIILSTQSS